jgi:hypothetical protein
MSAHPYLRAYMAGIVVPTVFVLVIFAVFCVARFVYDVDVPIERIIVFPLALVPNLWGLWNLLYVSRHSHRRLPLGLHGAVLPVLVTPLAVGGAMVLGFAFPSSFATAFLLAFPIVLVVYYVIWKYLVGFFNELLGIA